MTTKKDDISTEACCPSCGAKMKMSKMDAHYPWEQCIADQKERGHDQKSAEEICGSIKAKNN